MKNSILVLLTFIWLSTDFYGQKVNINPISKDQNSITTKALLPFGNEGIVKIKSDNFDNPSLLELQTYNLQHELLHQTTLSTKRENEWFAIEGTFIWNNSLVVLASLYHPGPQKNHLLLYQYSLPDLALINSKILLTSFAPIETRIPFLHQLAPNKSKLVIAAWSYKEERKNCNVALIVYDPNFKEIDYFQKILPFENRQFFPETVLIDNLGNCYYIGNKYEGNLAYDELNPMGMKKHLLAFFKDSNIDSLYSFPKNKINYELSKFTINPKQELIGLTLSKIRNKLSIDGVTFTKLDPIRKTLITHHNKIDKQQFKTAFTKNNPTLQLPKHSFSDEYDLKQIFPHPNGYYLMGDRYQSIGFGIDQNGQTVDKYELQDIFVIKLDTNGIFQWMSRIPKKQRMIEEFSPYFSFKAFLRKQSLLVVFNDAYENLKPVATKKLTSSTIESANLVLTQLSLTNGSIKKRKLQNFLGNQYLMHTNYTNKISDNELFFYANGRSLGVKKSIGKVLKLKPE